MHRTLALACLVAVSGCHCKSRQPAPAPAADAAHAEDASAATVAPTSAATPDAATAPPEKRPPAVSEEAPPCPAGQAQARAWKPVKGHPLLERAPLGARGEAWAETLRFSPGGRWIAALHGAVSIWDARCGGLRDTVQVADPDATTDVALSPDGARLAVASGDTLIVRRFAEGRIGAELARIRGPGARLSKLAFSVDGSRLAALDVSGRIWLFQDGAPRNSAPTAGEPSELAFSPDGTRLVVCTAERLELRDSRSLAKLAESPTTCVHVAHAPDGATLYVRVRTKDGHPVLAVRAHDLAPVSSGLESPNADSMWAAPLGVSSDGAYVASLVGDHLVVWKPPATAPIDDVADIDDDAFRALAFSPGDPREFAGVLQGRYQVRSAAGPQLYFWRLRPVR